MYCQDLSVSRFAAANNKPSAEAGGTCAGVPFRMFMHKTVNDVIDRIETMGDDIEVLRVA